MTPEQRWEALLAASKRVLSTFRKGNYPSFTQLQKLDNAIDAVEAQKICGHRFIEDCDCEDGEEGK